MGEFNWTYSWFGLVIDCRVDQVDARRALKVAEPDLATVRQHFEPVAQQAVLGAGGAIGDRWMFTAIRGRTIAEKSEVLPGGG